MSRIWMSSDFHFGHANIIRFCKRPYKDVIEMNEALVNNFNELVTKEDAVYLLGDLAMSFQNTAKYIPRLNFKELHCIYGNHDDVSHLHKHGKKDQRFWKQKYLDLGFTSVQDKLTIQIEGKDVLLHHFPYRASENGDHNGGYTVRYLDERQEDKGLTILHGHTHGRWVKKGNCVDVGVDAHNMKPVSIERIIEIINHNGDIPTTLYDPT